jgi:hypothetical protein
MLHYEELRQLTHERQRRLRAEAESERLARQAWGRQHRRRRRLALRSALELLLRSGRRATHASSAS